MAFDEQAYLAAKLQQLSANPQQAASVGWTGGSAADLKSFLSSAGMTPEQHYQNYGVNEGLSYSPQAAAPAPTPSAAPQQSQWQQDFSSFFGSNVTPGTVVNVGNGGKVTKMGDGTAVYQDATGAYIPFNQNTNPMDLGRQATQLGVDWATKYRTDSLTPAGEWNSGYSRVDPAAMGITINADGTVTRRGSGSAGQDYVSTSSLNEIKDPTVRAYYQANPDEFLAQSINRQTMATSPVGRSGNTYKNASWEDIYHSSLSNETPATPQGEGWADRVVSNPYIGFGYTPNEIQTFASQKYPEMLPAYYQALLGSGDLMKPNFGAAPGMMAGQAPTGATGGSTSPVGGSTGSSTGTVGGSITNSMFSPWLSSNSTTAADVNKAGAGGSSGDYNTQLQEYYKSYFGNDTAPNMNMLNSWYGGKYVPGQQGQTTNISGASVPGVPAGTESGGSGNISTSNYSGNLLGSGRMTDAINKMAVENFNKYVAVGIAPATAVALVSKVMADYEALKAVNAADDPLKALIEMQNEFDAVLSSGGSGGSGGYTGGGSSAGYNPAGAGNSWTDYGDGSAF